MCSDAFAAFGWGNVWEGDVGLRVCPTDPSQVQACTCSGGGAQAWIQCQVGCVAPCVGSVPCGGATCGPLEFCQLCAASGGKPTATCLPRAGSQQKQMCPKAGDLTFDAFCDGHDDCAATDRCTAVRGDLTRLTCEPASATATCGGSLLQQACKDIAQCPTCAKACTPSMFPDLQTPTGYGVGVCE